MEPHVFTPRFFRLLGFVVAATLVAVVSLSAGIAHATPPTWSNASSTAIERSSWGNWAKGRILVEPNAGLTDDDFANDLKVHGGKSLGRINGLGVHVVALPPNANEQAVVKALSHNPHIKSAEVDEIVTPEATTNDPILPQEWHIPTINASAAWGSSTGAGIVVAVLDTGVQSNHPDLQANLVPGWNLYDNNSSTNDVNGHGTAVAGTIAAIGNNGIGVVGVAYGAKIMPIRIADSTGSSTLSLLASGVTWAADHGADIANISYSNCYKSSTVISAANYLRSKGGETVVSANNNAVNEGTANTTSMITVSATDQSNALASFSSWGPMVDLAAPGVTIQTTLWNSGYGWGTGTSFATPIVAGTVALVMSANPALTPDQIENVLFSTATNLGAAGYDNYYGWGLVNAYGAVVAARGTTPPPADATPPSVAVASPASGTVSGIVPVSVNASDNVGVVRVELYVGGALFASDVAAPWSFSWDTTKSSNATYGVYARAYDAAGNAANSSVVNYTVSNGATADNTPPTVSIASPTGGTLSGVVPVSVNAADNVGVSKVELYVGGALYATDTAAPWSFSFDTTKKANGTYALSAKAYDAAGHVTTSSTVSVSVSNTTTQSGADTTPPTVKIVSPSNGSKVKGSSVKISASGSDNVGVASLSLYVDGVLKATANGSSLSYSWSTRGVSAGAHQISVTAKDAAGNAATASESVIR